MKNNFATLILLLLAFSGFSQEMGYDVFGTKTNPYAGPYSILTLDTLKEAKTLSDINAKYRSSWVARYISVEVSSICEEVIKKAVSQNDTLTHEQMGLLKKAEEGCLISVEVDYIPLNNLKYNPPRKMDFTLTTIPIFEAKYPGGYGNLKAYLKENIMDKIPETSPGSVKFAKVKFNITGKGQVSDAQISRTSENDKVDKLILEAIGNMPKWIPAQDSKGMKITQAFEFSMGTDLLRCDYQY
ncbi:MAG: TonB family protein [Saprospiraceae bacterium]|nr:TonB family protein [Saprospiraceae bacterium]MCB9325677.1 TonB family protein [Lewinellaceae bacterium]